NSLLDVRQGRPVVVHGLGGQGRSCERSPGTLDTYRYIYGSNVEPALGALRIREVTTPVLDRALLAVRVKSVSAARTSRIVISGVMRFAARHGAIVVNPTREVDRIEGQPKRRPRALTAQERREWLDALNHDPYAQAWDLPDITKLML